MCIYDPGLRFAEPPPMWWPSSSLFRSAFQNRMICSLSTWPPYKAILNKPFPAYFHLHLSTAFWVRLSILYLFLSIYTCWFLCFFLKWSNSCLIWFCRIYPISSYCSRSCFSHLIFPICPVYLYMGSVPATYSISAYPVHSRYFLTLAILDSLPCIILFAFLLRSYSIVLDLFLAHPFLSYLKLSYPSYPLYHMSLLIYLVLSIFAPK